MKYDYFRVFTNCIVTRGYTQSLISDLQREKSDFIPNSLAEIIERLNQKESLISIYKEYGKENKWILDEYLDFLFLEEYGFYCTSEEFDMFINLDLEYQSPDRISNIIIEFKKDELLSLQNIIYQVEKLGCKFVALVCYDELILDDFDIITLFFNDTIIQSVEIITSYSDNISKNIIDISQKFERLTSLFLFNAPPKMSVKSEVRNCVITFSQRKYVNFSFCGGINSDNFQTNLPKVLEAKNHNSCLHKKMSIDIDGNIKNCPAMVRNFGNIKDITLEKALNFQNFKQYWNTTKDSINICKDCEFRYICTDCRAFTEQSDIKDDFLDLSKPLKCGYDPYTGEWKEWSLNKLKQKAIDYYKKLW